MSVPFSSRLYFTHDSREETYSTDNVDETTKSKFLEKGGPMFYKEAALRTLDAYLEPTEHVIADLKESRKSISFSKSRNTLNCL